MFVLKRYIPEGLSPRVRGNLCNEYPNIMPTRSIPACAGEPARQHRHRGLTSVYPRVCGGTTNTTATQSSTRGLSPRVRGNQVPCTICQSPTGSIPACAGEPVARPMCNRKQRVYPRVCGGTAQVFNLPFGERGLSPRVRGNLNISYVCRYPVGSIPACAGEPSPLHDLSISHWVYPRVCGGTQAVEDIREVVKGLSPRVRGNHRTARRDIQVKRSIPACAGEPARQHRHRGLISVYPRVCGGTASIGLAKKGSMGLSPRVRGNRVIRA